MQIRRAELEDVPVCGKICYEAFAKINADHGFPPDLPSVEFAQKLLSMMFSNSGFYCVVAEEDGKILGSNCLDERASIFGVGPITVDPAAQNRRVGRALMQAVMDRAKERKAAGVRLVQAAFHNRSLALYTTLGFDPREQLACMQGTIGKTVVGFNVRAAAARDADECNALCFRVHGHDRAGELADMIGQGAVVVERNGKITGYASIIGFFGHAVAETNDDLKAMIAAAESFAGPGILVPVRNADLFRWCLANGLRVTQPMTLMSLGLYNEPAGAFLPSILY